MTEHSERTIEHFAPTLTPTPPRRASLRSFAARQVFDRWTARLDARFGDSTGRRWGQGAPGTPEMFIVRPGEFYDRIGRDANVGFGEAFQSGAWTSPDPAEILALFAARLTASVNPRWQSLRLLGQRIKGQLETNDHAVARRNIEAHYDLSNELFATFLDPTMTYSAAWFAGTESLEQAQLRKIDGVLDLAHVGSGTRVLEIGTGWGALAIRAAQRGAIVTTLTLSKEQAALARERAIAAGVADQIDIRLQDYRDATGAYDAVVSVEMIEAVGEEYWPTFFRKIEESLVPGGRASLQAITMPHERLAVSRRAVTWINKYIFPGGLIPSMQAIQENLSKHTGLRVGMSRSLGADYARTLAMWRDNFHASADQVARLGFDETFSRTWEYYLSYCEAGFRSRYIDVMQLELVRA